MSAIFQRRPDEVFIITEDESFYSREQKLLKQDANPYQSGELVVSEIVSSAKTGKYIRATEPLADASAVEDYAIVCRWTDASAADTNVAGIVRFARVKGAELTFDSTLNLASVTALAAAQGIIVS